MEIGKGGIQSCDESTVDVKKSPTGSQLFRLKDQYEYEMADYDEEEENQDEKASTSGLKDQALINSEEPTQQSAFVGLNAGQTDLEPSNQIPFDEQRKSSEDENMVDQTHLNSKGDSIRDTIQSNVTFGEQEQSVLYDQQGKIVRVISGDLVMYGGTSLNRLHELNSIEAESGQIQKEKVRWMSSTSHFVDSARVHTNKLDILPCQQILLKIYHATRVDSHKQAYDLNELRKFKKAVRNLICTAEEKMKLSHPENVQKHFYSGSFLDISYCHEALERNVQISEKDFNIIPEKANAQTTKQQFKSDLHKADSFIRCEEVEMWKVNHTVLFKMVNTMFQNQFNLQKQKTGLTLEPHLIRDNSQVYQVYMVELSNFCDMMFPSGVKTLEQFLRCIMAQLFNYCQQKFEISEFDQLWTNKGVIKRGGELVLSVAKVASLAIGLPFTNKCGRMAWYNSWSSLLLTWNVHRGFQADMKQRRVLQIVERLCFDSVNEQDAIQVRLSADKLRQKAKDMQKEDYLLLTVTQANNDMLERLKSFQNQLPLYWKNFTRPHFLEGRQVDFFQVSQPVPQLPSSFLDFVLINLHTTEVNRLRLGKPSAMCVSIIVKFEMHLQQHAQVLLGHDATLIDSVLSYSYALLGNKKQISYDSFPQIMEDIVSQWKSMFVNNPTMYKAVDVGMIYKLLEQKEYLNQEIQQLNSCSYIEEQFQEARIEFIEQIKVCFDVMPYYLDMLLRRLLIRYFAEIWLPREHLINMFKCSLDQVITTSCDDFSADDKPRATALKCKKTKVLKHTANLQTPKDYITKAAEYLSKLKVGGEIYVQGVSLLLYCLDSKNGPQNPVALVHQILSLKDNEYGKRINGHRLEWFAVKARQTLPFVSDQASFQDQCIKYYMQATKLYEFQLSELAYALWPVE